MTLEGIVRNGVIIPEGTPPPDGTRVRYEHVAPDEDDDEDDDIGPPPSTETREEFLASLRESVAEARAGVGGMTLDEAMAFAARENNLPWPPVE